MTGGRTGSRRADARRGMVGAVVLVALAVVAGCGSSKKAASTTTTAGSGAAGQSSQLSAMASSIRAGEQATFKAVYTYNGAGASPGPVTIEQKPPKTLFKAGSAEIIGTGTATYYCSVQGTATCFSTGTSNPLAAITQLFNPDNAATAIQEAEAAAAAHQVGYNVSFSTESFAGVSADCATVSSSSVTGKYCVTKSGVLAYSGTSSVSFELTSYSTSVSDSDFTLPAGASTQSIPSVP